MGSAGGMVARPLPGRGRHPRRPRGRRVAGGEPRRATACRAAESTRPVRPARRRGPHARVGGPGFGGRPLARRPPADAGVQPRRGHGAHRSGRVTGTGWSRARVELSPGHAHDRARRRRRSRRRRASPGGCRTSAARPSCSHRTHPSGGVPGWRSSSAARSSRATTRRRSSVARASRASRRTRW